MFVLAKPEEYGKLASLACGLWHDAYDELFGSEQVEYMTSTMQSAEAIAKQTEGGYLYFFIVEGGQTIGYCGIRPEGTKMFLSKLYLCAEQRGKGLGRRALAEVAEQARRRGLSSVYLTVNKGNERAIRAYERFGFVRADSTVTDIGGGFAMDDYIYEFKL